MDGDVECLIHSLEPLFDGSFRRLPLRCNGLVCQTVGSETQNLKLGSGYSR